METLEDILTRFGSKIVNGTKQSTGQGGGSRLLPDRHPVRDFFIADILDWALKDDRHSMEHPFFSKTDCSHTSVGLALFNDFPTVDQAKSFALACAVGRDVSFDDGALEPAEGICEAVIVFAASMPICRNK